MQRLWRGLLATSAVATAVALGACTSNDTTLFVRGIITPPSTAPGATCVFTADANQAFLGSGTLDVALADSYQAALAVGSQLIGKADPANVRAETARLFLQGTVVRITDAAGAEIKSFTRLSTTMLDPAAGSTPSYGVFFSTLVDPGTVDQLKLEVQPGTTKRLVAYVKVFGTTLGHQSIESNEFQYPITVCSGCLVAFPPESNDTALQAITPGRKRNCAGQGQAAAFPCRMGNDQAIDCRYCQGNAVCDPNYPDKTPDPIQTPTTDGGAP